MRKRTVRDLGTIVGIIVVLLGVVAINYMTRQRNLKERMIAWREQIEQNRERKGLDLLPWSLLEKTKGNMRRGPRFADELLLWENKKVDLVGFMIPSDKFREMEEFLLLPMPIECYFCQAPPMRDILLVQMKEGHTAELYNEPILLNGRLQLNHGPDNKFFYVVKEAVLGPGEKDTRLTRKHMSELHAGHYQAARLAEELAKQKLLEGQEPPKPKGPETDQDAQKAAERERIATENLLTAELFFDGNLKEDGVEVIPHSGVQYKILESGEGRKPQLHGRVKCHYRGTLLDGTEFDNSYERDKAAVFPRQQGDPRLDRRPHAHA